jgi:hypothetical protein
MTLSLKGRFVRVGGGLFVCECGCGLYDAVAQGQVEIV